MYLSAVAHTHYSFKRGRLYLYLTGMLGVEQCLVDDGGLIVPSVVVFKVGLYLTQINFLFDKTGELRYLGVVGQLRYINEGVEFVGQYDTLLFKHQSMRNNSMTTVMDSDLIDVHSKQS